MSTTHTLALYGEGERLLAAGRSIVPVRGKVPIWVKGVFEGWERLKHTPLTTAELAELVSYATGLAIIGGQVSGGLEILDFDYKLGRTLWPTFKEKAGPSLLSGITWQRTGSRKGFQGAYRCPQPGPSIKLAAIDSGDPDPRKRWIYLIETRGEGGYAVVPPSLHPDTHRHYEYLVGHFADVELISQDQRDSLHALARSLTERHDEPASCSCPRVQTPLMRARMAEADVVKDLFNQQHSIEDWLVRLGYTVRGRYAIRPGGRRPTVRIANNRSYHNNTNDPLCDGRGTEGYWRTPFELFLQYEHGGDFRAAIQAAAAQVGVDLVTSRSYRSRPHVAEMPPVPPPPLPPPPPDRQSLIVITDHPADVDVLHRLQLPVVVSPRYRLDPGVVAAIEPYAQRLLLTAPPDEGLALALAADLSARLVELPAHLSDLAESGTLTLVDLVGLFRSAIEPVYRLGHRLGR